ncbi:hypothetical protein TI03_04265, partial [Achromatium sp. WMS1]
MPIQLYRRRDYNWLHWRIILTFTVVIFIFNLVSVFLAFPIATDQIVMGILRNLVRSISLFSIDQALMEAPDNPWYFELAKILSVLAFFSIATKAFFQFVLERYAILRLKRERNHIVIINGGDCGLQLAKDYLVNKQKVLIIDPDPSSSQQEFTLAHDDVLLFTGDGTKTDTLEVSGAPWAKMVFFVGSDDIENLQGTMSLRKWMQNKGVRRTRYPLIVYVRVSTGALFQQIKAHPYFVREDHNLG